MVPVAVVGIGCLFPGSDGNAGFWRDIVTGRDLIQEVPPTHWLREDFFDPQPGSADKVYCTRGAFLSPVAFEPMAFGVPPADVPSTDSAQLLALVVARQLLDALPGVNRERTSVILGVASATALVVEMAGRLQRPIWVKALREAGLPEDQVQATCERLAASYVPWTETTFPGMLGNVVAGRIANRLDLGGTNCVVDAACASSLAAVEMAVLELSLGRCDLALSGGVDTLNHIFMFMAFSKTMALSRTGDSRPFSDRADGTVLGEGIGMVALKRLADAEREGDPIYAVIRGLGSSSDGLAKSVFAPRADGQAKALRRAYESGGVSPAEVELLEAHGTGTEAGDAAEVEALSAVFREADASRRQWCALGSVKSQIGHTKAAAGVAGLIKAVLALHHKVLPPTIKVERPNPRLNLAESPFYLNTQPRPWVHAAGSPRRASVSSFGFGGSNFHVTLEEYRGPGRRPARLRWTSELCLLSAPDAGELAAACRRLAEGFAAPADGSASREAAMARFLQTARASQAAFRREDAARLAVVAADGDDLAAKLRLAADKLAAGAAPGVLGGGVHYASGRADPGRVALLFPGQGSQYVGMGTALAMAFDEARAVWDEAAGQRLAPDARLDEVVFPRPAFREEERQGQAERLTRTEWAQPAIGAASLAGLALLRAAGLEPDCVAGHSFGELTALCAAGALESAELLRLARIRGEVMARATGAGGAMTSVFCSPEQLRPMVAEAGPGLALANLNAPEQVVVSGPAEGLARMERLLAERGVRFQRLPVAAAFHSPLMEPAADAFAEALREAPLQAPSLPVFSCWDGAPFPTSPDAIRSRLARQIAHPVRFTAQVEAMYAHGVRCFVEVGPGSVLTGLVGQCLAGQAHLAVSLDRRRQDGVEAFWEALGRLAVAGVPLRLAGLWPEAAPLPARPAGGRGMRIAVSGAPFGRPYPPAGGVGALAPPHAAAPSGETPPPARTAAGDSGAGPARAVAPDAEVRFGQAADDGTAGAAALAVPAHRLAVFQELSRQAAEAQAAFEKTLAESHNLFLKASEASLQALTALLGAPLSAGSAAPDTGPTQEVTALPPAPAVAPEPMAWAPAAGAPEPVGPAPASAPSPPAGGSLRETLLGVVAEKTGYPTEMLGLDLELEADLGIDSIKRVEILAALQERLPGLPPVEPAELASLGTLGKILAHLEAALGAPHDPVPREAAPGAPLEPAPREPAPGAPLEPAPREAAAAAGSPPIAAERRVVEVRAQEACGFGIPGIAHSGAWVAVTDDGEGLARQLAAQLAAAGIDARAVERVPPEAPAVVLLDGLRSCTAPEEAVAVQREAFLAVRTVAPRMAAAGGVLVMVQDTGGDFGLSGRAGERAWLAGLAALAKTAAHEWPAATVRAIDLARGGRAADELARVLVQELLAGGPEREVGLLADGRRLTVVTRPAEAHPGDMPLPPGAVVVASGGARGVTAACLRVLSAAIRPRLAVLGRTPLNDAEPPALAGALEEAELVRVLGEEAARAGERPSPAELGRRAASVRAAREARENLEALRGAGADVRYLQVDVRDREAVAAALDRVRAAWGPVDGLIHAAGVIADKPIAAKTPAQFDEVFGTKVVGLQALLAATRDDPLRLICFFSSVAARDGNAGQADYAMANEVLNRVAAAEALRRGGNCRVKAIGWGPWEGGMVTPAVAGHFRRRGVALLPVDAGCRSFLQELSQPVVEVLVAAGPLDGGEERCWTMELTLSPSTHPYLADHGAAGVPVLPLALVLEWFARAAAACRPDLPLAAVEELTVRSAVRLDGFAARPRRLAIRCRGAASGAAARLRLELLDPDGRPAYSAVAVMGPREEGGPPPSPAPPATASDPWPWTVDAVYRGMLPHGPRFRVIRDLLGLSPSGAEALLDGAARVGWNDPHWRTDPALLEGGLQVAGLWGLWSLGAPTLPQRVAAFLPRTESWPAEPVRCTLQGQTVGRHQVVTDLAFHDPRGRLLAELRGVEASSRPDGMAD